MAKMFYTAKEAAQEVGCREEDLEELMKEGKLRQFRDAENVHYKKEDIDELPSSEDFEHWMERARQKAQIIKLRLQEEADSNDTSLGSELLEEIYEGREDDDGCIVDLNRVPRDSVADSVDEDECTLEEARAAVESIDDFHKSISKVLQHQLTTVEHFYRKTTAEAAKAQTWGIIAVVCALVSVLAAAAAALR